MAFAIPNGAARDSPRRRSRPRLPEVGMRPSIRVDRLSKRYRIHAGGAEGGISHAAGEPVGVDDGAAAPPAPGCGPARFLGAQGRRFRDPAGRGGGRHRPQRRRQEHPAENPVAHHRADGRPGPAQRPGRQPARSRHRLPSGADRPREHLPQRRHPRHEAPGDRPPVRRHRRLRRAGKIPRHAGQALFERHVRAAGLQRGRPHRAGDPAGGRGAGGRRRTPSRRSAWARWAPSPAAAAPSSW